MNHDIFISYSHMQKSIADGVCHYLEENGFKCWMAPRDISVGSEYGDLIEEAIKTSKVVVLVFSQSASISKWVKGEVNVAFAEDKPILPFRVDDTEIKGGFRVMLNQMHWIDAFPQYADRLPDLLNSVCGFLGRQPQKVSENNERLEAERKAKEEAERARLERERIAKVEAEREAEEVKRKAEQKRRERERAEARHKVEREKANRLKVSYTPQTKSKKALWFGLGLGAIAVVAVVLVLVWPNSQPVLLSVSGNYNGHDYVDLGLPSGTLWATCNIGASTPEGYGNYYAWGETSTKTIYNWSTYKYSNGNSDKITKYCKISSYGYDGYKDSWPVLMFDDDVATVNWGNGWQIPSEQEWRELEINTKSTWKTINGIKGRLFKAPNGNNLFLPAAGWRSAEQLRCAGSEGDYWSSSLAVGGSDEAQYFEFASDGCCISFRRRYIGGSVRALCNSSYPN